MTTPEEKARDYFTRNAAFYTTSPAHTDRAVLDRMVKLAKPQPSDRVLDIATGTGHTALALAPHVAEVVATDLTFEMLQEARRLSLKKQSNTVTFCLHNSHYLPFSDNTFDIVTCRRACHHFTNLPAALKEMHRVLRIDGRLVIDDRSVPEDAFVDRMMNRLDLLHDPSHIRQYSSLEWQDMLVAVGFQFEAIEIYTRARPLSALTQGAAPEDAAEIKRLLLELTPEHSEKLHYNEREGEPHLRHWYLTVLAKK